MSWDKPYSDWNLQCIQWKQKWEHESIPEKFNGYFSIYQVIDYLNRCVSANHIIVTDAGSPSYVCPINLKKFGNMRLIFSQSQADMGFAIPASIGIALESKLPVIVIVGDGSFMSNVQELATISGMNLPIKIIVLNNCGYMSIRNTQKNFYNNRIHGVDNKTGVHIPRISQMADAFNIEYLNFDDYYKPTKYNECIIFQEYLNNDTPIIFEAHCLENEEIIPMQSFKTIDGKKIQAGLDDMYPFLLTDKLE